MIDQSNYVAFSDDSTHKSGRYHSLSLVTAARRDFDEVLLPSLENIFAEFEMKSEFKWQKLRDNKHSHVAENMINFVFSNRLKMRVDNIIWDMEDSRHKDLIGRDDNENLARMYYHLFMATTSKRWGGINGVYWKWMPDRQSSVDWDMLRDCICSKKHSSKSDMFRQSEIPPYESVNLEEISPSDSESNLFIQIADLFAGISACSYGDYQEIKKWEKQKNLGLNLYEEPCQKFSTAQQRRYPIITNLNNLCKDNKLGISFSDTKMGFYSPPFRAENFLNFWLYTPQSKFDKAPIRDSMWIIRE